jgi:hypothetical protein
MRVFKNRGRWQEADDVYVNKFAGYRSIMTPVLEEYHIFDLYKVTRYVELSSGESQIRGETLYGITVLDIVSVNGEDVVVDRRSLNSSTHSYSIAQEYIEELKHERKSNP